MPKNNLQGTLDLLILQAMYAIPGVKNDGTVDALPFSGENHGGFISAGVPGLSGWDNRSVAEIDVIGGDYLQTMRVHLMTGRWFRQDETHNSSKIAIVNDVVARRLWPRRSAIGQQICVGCTQENPSDWRQVVGVVSMFRHAALDGPPPQNVYLSAGAFENTVFVVVKTNRPMGEMGSAIRRAIAGVNPAESYEVRYNDQNQMLFVSCPDRGRITAGEVPNAGLYSLCPTSSVTTDLDKGTLRGYTEKHGGPGYPQFLSFSQSFAYDPVNRLQTASDSDGWSRSFSYDQYGNQWLSGASGINPSAWNRQSASDIDPAKNQVWYAQYDRAGNQTRIASALWLSYDAENRQIQSYDSQWHTLANQYYDGLGQRVAKILPDGSTRLYVYDAFGRLAEKYSSAAQSALCATCYLSYDHLALVRLSPAMITCPSAKRSGVGRRIVIATLGPGVHSILFKGGTLPQRPMPLRCSVQMVCPLAMSWCRVTSGHKALPLKVRHSGTS